MDFNLVSIDKNTTVSIAQQIAILIQKNIDKKILLPGDRLPTERELSEALNVARGTIKSAYKKLEDGNIIETRQGSGSYVLQHEHIFTNIKRREAIHLMANTIQKLKALDYKNKDIFDIVSECISRGDSKNVSVAVVLDSQEILLDIKNQLAALDGLSISIFMLESITASPDPEKLLNPYDLIILPSICYTDIKKTLPTQSYKIIKAATAPNKATIVKIATLSKEGRIGIIARTNTYLNLVKETLLSYGFQSENIFSFFESDYTVDTYFPGGIHALVTFSHAHIFTDPTFEWRNKELILKGGKIVEFVYEIEEGSLIYIEDKIHALLENIDFLKN